MGKTCLMASRMARKFNCWRRVRSCFIVCKSDSEMPPNSEGGMVTDGEVWRVEEPWTISAKDVDIGREGGRCCYCLAGRVVRPVVNLCSLTLLSGTGYLCRTAFLYLS